MSNGMQLAQWKGYLEKSVPKLQEVAAGEVRAEKIVKHAMIALSRNPKLAQCSQPSVMKSVMDCVVLGLMPGVLGQVYLLPYKTECQAIIGYKGLVDLCRRSGNIIKVEASAVREGDVFEWEKGTSPFIKHQPTPNNTGKLEYAYAIAWFKGGGTQFEVLDRKAVEKRKAMSQSANSSYSPWTKWEDEMWRKTAVRYLCNLLPLSVEVKEMITRADEAEVLDTEVRVVDAEFDPFEEGRHDMKAKPRPEPPSALEQALNTIDKMRGIAGEEPFEAICKRYDVTPDTFMSLDAKALDKFTHDLNGAIDAGNE